MLAHYFTRRRQLLIPPVFSLLITICVHSQEGSPQVEMYRPRIHFSPLQKWMNDPNGLVYFKETYHLFYQYYPDSTVWGPMHWGHAISKDLVHWEHQPVALYPDSLGYIFSGSAVVDWNNTSGLGSAGQIPLVAIFTHHDPEGERNKKNNYQNQSIAYSLDNGKTWTKYPGNPVLRNPGVADFRDPKVMWHTPTKKWIMTLAVKDQIYFYSSRDLINWTKQSQFGQEAGAHGGVWECPDLFQLTCQGKKYWVLIVNLNPGGPNGGSATQYFVGDFDGRSFQPIDTKTRWLDYGPDEYAGVTWSNTGERKIFLGWMSNWEYANVVPTRSWRNAMTIPRELKLMRLQDDWRVASVPVKELASITGKPIVIAGLKAADVADLSTRLGPVSFPCRLDLVMPAREFSFVLENEVGEKLVVGFDESANRYFIDRTASGNVGFQKNFAGYHVAPRFSKAQHMDVSLVIDVSSIELFADGGLSVMTEIFFPHSPYTKISLTSKTDARIKQLRYSRMQSIWTDGTFH